MSSRAIDLGARPSVAPDTSFANDETDRITLSNEKGRRGAVL